MSIRIVFQQYQSQQNNMNQKLFKRILRDKQGIRNLVFFQRLKVSNFSLRQNTHFYILFLHNMVNSFGKMTEKAFLNFFEVLNFQPSVNPLFQSRIQT